MQLIQCRTFIGTISLMGVVLALAACGSGNAFSVPASGSDSTPTISSLAPASASVGGADFTLKVNGSNFTTPTWITWNGIYVPTTIVNSQQLTVTISSQLISAAGSVNVIVYHNMLMSNLVQFVITNPTPLIASISPDTEVAGSPPVLATVIGSGFFGGTSLLLDGSPWPILSRTPTQLQAMIPASDLATPKSITFSVANPAPSGPSNDVTFTVTPFTSNPAPTLTSASDQSVPAGWPGFQLHVYGSNFVAASVLQWNGADQPTAVISATELSAAISADQLVIPGTSHVSVTNPSPGGGSSNLLSIQVQPVAPDAVGVIERSDIGTDLTEPDGESQLPAVSSDGRFVAFLSSADNLAPDVAPEEEEENLYLRDTCVGAPTGCVPSVTFISATKLFKPAISANGRFVAFTSDEGVFLYDSCSSAPAGCVSGIRNIHVPADWADEEDGQVSLSADGRFAVYYAGELDCGYWDYCAGASVLLNDTCAGMPSSCMPTFKGISPFITAYDSTGASLLTIAHPSISPDGRFIAYNTNSAGIVLYDSCQAATANCSPSTTNVTASDTNLTGGISYGASVISGGRYVAFLSSSGTLVPGNLTQGAFRFYLHDTCTGAPAGCTPATTLLATAGASSQLPDEPSISADGRYVAFASSASDLVTGDTNGTEDVFVLDTCIGAAAGCSSSMERVSVALDGSQGYSDSLEPMISSDGRFFAFSSLAKLGPGLGGGAYLARH